MSQPKKIQGKIFRGESGAGGPQPPRSTSDPALTISIPKPADGEGKVFEAPLSGDAAKGTPWDGDALAAATRDITLEVFALDESASVQVRFLAPLTRA